MDKQTIKEKVREEFEKLTPESNYKILGCNDYLYGNGGYNDWLKNNPHLYEESVYLESMFELSKEKILKFIDSTIDSVIKEREEELINRIEKIKESIREINGTFKYDSCYDDIINLIKSK